MANTQQTVRINIAEVGAQQATKDTKSLKQQIKELREELVNLDKDTDEYNQKIQQLGNLMHQQSEITEQARIATDDYGQQLNNLSTIASGVVGSITAVQGVMNLLGGENEDAMKAVKTMTSLMSILQGLSALESFEKTMGRMWTNVKKLTTATNEENVSMKVNTVEAGKNAGAMAGAAAATKAQGAAAATTTKGVNLLSVGFKNLGTALKSFMVSNPFTLILLGVTALITAISKLVSDTKEANEEFKKMQLEAKLANSEASGMSFGTGESDDQRRQRGVRSVDFSDIAVIENDTNQIKLLGELERGLQKVKTTIEQYGYALIDAETQEKILANTSVKDINDLNQVTQALLKTRNELNGVLYKQYAAQVDTQQELVNLLEQEYNLMTNNGKNAKAMQAEEAKALEERLKKEKQILENYTNRRNRVMDDLAAIEDAEVARAKKQRQDEEAKRKQQLAEAQNKMQKDLAQVNQKYELLKKKEENAYNRQEKTTKEHWEREKEIEEQYWDEISKKYEKYVKRGLMTQQQYDLYREQHLANLLAIEKNIHNEILKIWEHKNNPALKIALENAEIRQRELMMEYNDAVEANKRMLNAQLDYENKSRELREASLYDRYKMLDKWNRESFELEYQAQQQKLNLELEGLQKEQEARWEAYDRARAQENAQFEYEKEYNRQALSKEEYDRKLEDLELQHQERLKQIQNEYIQDTIDTETQVAEIRYELAENEYTHEVELFNRKMDLTRQYLQAFSTMVGGVQGLLTELQGAYEQGSKEYEAIEEANIIMSGITGALQAWQSGMAAAPAPYNLIIAAAMAGISTATTIAALANLKSKKLSSSASSASINVNPYETISTETGAELNGNIQDQRVVVVESDITDTVNRVRVAEDEASF